MEELVRKIADIAHTERLWQRGETIVVAVSGGPDSSALLHALHRLADPEGIRLVAAHVDHGFRGEESAQEAEMVRAFAGRLGVPFETVRLDLPVYIEETRMNAQAAARKLRYDFLHEVAARRGAARIALAHHADDQAETVLMRILRGAGPGSLAGIPIRRREKKVELIRPLLRMNKIELLRYCEENGVPYCIDSSNEQRYYFRNEVRLDILPYLSRFNPRLPEALARLSEIAAEEDAWMAGETEAAFKRLVRCSGGECAMDRRPFLGLHVALQRRLIKLILNYLSLETETASFERIETIRLAALGEETTWTLDAGGGIRCVREYDTLRWISQRDGRSLPGRTGRYAYRVSADCRLLHVPEAGCSFRFDEAPGGEKTRPSGRMEACFDADRLAYPLTVRNRRPGDRMRVIGLNGSKKVQDMFIDEKIPPSRREAMPLLTDSEDRIVWIPGLRRSPFALPDDSTRRVLRVRVERCTDAEERGDSGHLPE